MYMDIILKNITKSFHGQLVLDNFNGIIEKNKFNYIMGRSGVGKTTLINIIMGIVRQDYGEVLGLEGKKITVVFQEDRLCEDFDAITNIKLVTTKDIKDDEIIKLLEDLGLGESIYKKVSFFSGGMKRRLAIARALITNPDIIIMDEPLKGLDKELYLKVLEYIEKKLEGKTVIMITHSEEDLRLGDRILPPFEGIKIISPYS